MEIFLAHAWLATFNFSSQRRLAVIIADASENLRSVRLQKYTQSYSITDLHLYTGWRLLLAGGNEQTDDSIGLVEHKDLARGSQTEAQICARSRGLALLYVLFFD